MNIYSGLLFLQGHITNIDLARQLTGVEAAPAVPPLPDEQETAGGTSAAGKQARPGASWQQDPCANA
ncbi:hypothetical protein KQ945_04420 [Bacillus subtilis subsp. subtilis]|nr:hypothetical protein [Bacillus subtilis subsp. subtilis]